MQTGAMLFPTTRTGANSSDYPHGATAMTPQETGPNRARQVLLGAPTSNAAKDHSLSTTVEPRFNSWEGRLFGGLVLSAFLLYGIGSALVDEPIGLVLALANSVAVATVGVIGFRLLRPHHPRAGATYLAARISEAVLLGGGVVLYSLFDVAEADNTGYLLGMIALGVGSVPFWLVVGRGPWLSKRFALWGIVGYVALAAGALLELTTGRDVVIIASLLGGLFEVAVGIHLLRRGFATT